MNLARRLLNLIKVEARIAGKSVATILMLSVVAAFLLMSIWGCLLALLFIYLNSIQFSIPAAIFIILLLNFFLLLICAFMISREKKNIRFLIN